MAEGEVQKNEVQRWTAKGRAMALEIDIMQEAIKPYRPFDDTTSSE